MSLESLYLQKNYKDPSSTPLETIFESPRPSKGVQQGRASPDAALLMTNRKLKRLCIFSSHHQLPRNKLKQRKERALKMKRLTGVQVPLGKAFSEDDVLAVLSCLAEEEAATPSIYQEQEKEVLEPPNTFAPDLVEGMISVLNSLQMDSEPSLGSPNQAYMEVTPGQSQPSKERKKRRRCELFSQVKVNSSSTPSASTSRSQPPKTTAWVKRLKRRSGLTSQKKNSSLMSPFSDPKTATNFHEPKSCSREQTMPKEKRQNVLTDTEEHTTSTEIPRLKLGSKRTPDSILATSTKKLCTHKTIQETTADPSPTLQHSKGSGKDKKWRVARVELHDILAQESSLKNSLGNVVTTSSEQGTASPLLHTPVSELSTPLPTLSKTGLSPTFLDSLIACGSTTTDGDAESREKGIGKEGGTSPSSPSSKLAALTLHSSPTQLSPLVKPQKIRRRSARLSIGSNVIEGLRMIQNNNSSSSDGSLGTVWPSHSPLEQKQKAEVNKAVNSGSDPVSPLPSTATTKKRLSKGRCSSQYSHLEIMDTMGENAITTNTKSTSDVDDFSLRPISPSSVSLESLTQVPINPTVVDSATTLHHQSFPFTSSMKPVPHRELSLSTPQPLMSSMKQEDIPKVLTLTTTPVIDEVMPPENPQVMTEGEEESGPCNFLSTSTPFTYVSTPTHSNLKGFLDFPSPSSTFTASTAPAPALTVSQNGLIQAASPDEKTTTAEGDFDSLTHSGILTNKTLIRMGKVYYGPPVLTPLSSPAPL